MCSLNNNIVPVAFPLGQGTYETVNCRLYSYDPSTDTFYPYDSNKFMEQFMPPKPQPPKISYKLVEYDFEYVEYKPKNHFDYSDYKAGQIETYNNYMIQADETEETAETPHGYYELYHILENYVSDMMGRPFDLPVYVNGIIAGTIDEDAVNTWEFKCYLYVYHFMNFPKIEHFKPHEKYDNLVDMTGGFLKFRGKKSKPFWTKAEKHVMSTFNKCETTPSIAASRLLDRVTSRPKYIPHTVRPVKATVETQKPINPVLAEIQRDTTTYPQNITQSVKNISINSLTKEQLEQHIKNGYIQHYDTFRDIYKYHSKVTESMNSSNGRFWNDECNCLNWKALNSVALAGCIYGGTCNKRNNKSNDDSINLRKKTMKTVSFLDPTTHKLLYTYIDLVLGRNAQGQINLDSYTNQFTLSLNGSIVGFTQSQLNTFISLTESLDEVMQISLC